jgi:hypothetical protein
VSNCRLFNDLIMTILRNFYFVAGFKCHVDLFFVKSVDVYDRKGPFELIIWLVGVQTILAFGLLSVYGINAEPES